MSAVQSGALTPFQSKNFSVLWVAGVLSTTGTRMHEVGAGWLMTTLSSDPLMVALVQTAAALPIFLFALIAGAVADVASKRQLLIYIQAFMGVIAALLTYIVFIGEMTPTLLLAFIFILGTGAAFVAPTRQAIVPKLVPKEDLPSAIALNSVGFNLSRAIGPAIAGILITTIGIAVPFAFNAISFFIVASAYFWWCPGRVKNPLPKEQITGAMMAGLRYVRYSPPLKATLWRACAFFVAASAFWALLPLLVKMELKGEASLFGLLIAAIGSGAIFGALTLAWLKEKLEPGQLLAFASLLLVIVFIVAASVQIPVVIALACMVFGLCWIWVLSTFNVSAQLALPDWVRARGLAIYLMVFFGAMSVGSILWGALASSIGICDTLLVAAATLGLGALLTRKLPLNQGQSADLAPSMHWPEPIVVVDEEDEKELVNERSPVMVTIEYIIEKPDVEKFLSLMCQLGQVRKQYGAYKWDILEESDQPGTFIEYFLDVSWLEHLRHHQRVTGRDRELQQQIHALHQAESPPKVRHFFGSLAVKCNG